MLSLRSSALLAAALAPSALTAQVASKASAPTIEGVVSVAAGATLLDGDRPAFQHHFNQKKDGYGGFEELRYKRETKTSVFQIDGRLMPGNDEYALHLRFDQNETWYVDGGYDSYRIWYDGSGGYFRPTNTSFRLYDEGLYIDRSKLWLELGWAPADKPYFKLRAERSTREGQKGSTHWGDTNLTSVYSTRNIVPTYLDIDEVRDVVTFDAGHETDNQQWKVGVRYDHSELDNKKNTRRRPLETTADRFVTTKDETVTDIFSAHAFTERRFSEKLSMSTGGIITSLDTNLEGSRIYGASGYDPVFDPAYSRRQARDEGYLELGGGSQMKQYVFNLNLVYLPAKNWNVRTAFRFEDMRVDNVSTFIESNIATNLSAVLEEIEAESERKWDEFTESVEIKYTGMPNWTYNWRAEWTQGTGDLDELRLIEETNTTTISRLTDYTRDTQKYSFTSNWYARPGLTFSAQYYFKVRLNDYDAVRDSTPGGSADRYPAYIVDQDFETNDFNVRMTWRPASNVSLVTRYDYQKSNIISTEAGLFEVTSSKATTHIISQNVTWNPTARLYIVGNVNKVWDQVATPAYMYVLNGDNNYLNASLAAGYALGKVTDIYADYTYYKADNFADNSATSLPYGADEKRNVLSVTWVRRQNENLIYTLKYSFASNRDVTSGNRNNYDAHVLYGKVQYRF
jgi:hypothetical protein